MITRTGNVGVVTLVLVLVLTTACRSDAGQTSTPSTSSSTSTTATEPAEHAANFPIAAFAAITEALVSEELTAQLQAVLQESCSDNDVYRMTLYNSSFFATRLATSASRDRDWPEPAAALANTN